MKHGYSVLHLFWEREEINRKIAPPLSHLLGRLVGPNLSSNPSSALFLSVYNLASDTSKLILLFSGPYDLQNASQPRNHTTATSAPTKAAPPSISPKPSFMAHSGLKMGPCLRNLCHIVAFPSPISPMAFLFLLRKTQMFLLPFVTILFLLSTFMWVFKAAYWFIIHHLLSIYPKTFVTATETLSTRTTARPVSKFFRVFHKSKTPQSSCEFWTHDHLIIRHGTVLWPTWPSWRTECCNSVLMQCHCIAEVSVEAGINLFTLPSICLTFCLIYFVENTIIISRFFEKWKERRYSCVCLWSAQVIFMKITF